MSRPYYAPERRLEQVAIVAVVWAVRAYHLTKGRAGDVRARVALWRAKRWAA